jgi:MFS family permease
MVMGSVVFSRAVRRPLGPMITLGTMAVGLAYLGFAAAPTLAWACAAALIGGTGNGMQWAALITAVQQLTPEALHGRLMAAVQAINALCPAVGFSLGGVLAAITSPRTAMLAAGIGATAATVIFARLSAGGLGPEVGRPGTPLSTEGAEWLVGAPVLGGEPSSDNLETAPLAPVATRDYDD